MAYTTTVVRMDSSTYEKKKEELRKKGYYRLDRWDVPAFNYVLPRGENYINYIIESKGEESAKTREVDIESEIRLKTEITTQLYRGDVELGHERLLFASVSSISYRGTTFTPDLDPFVGLYVLTNVTVEDEHLQFIQLTRYDPVGQGLHINDLSKKERKERAAYEYYFGTTVPYPHMHFGNLCDAEKCGVATKNAISLYKLLEYLVDLKKENNEHGALDFDLGMPYHELQEATKRGENLYQTTYPKEAAVILDEFWKILKKKQYNSADIERAIDAAEQGLCDIIYSIEGGKIVAKSKKETTNKMVKNLFNGSNKLEESEETITFEGLDAVIIDVLYLLMGYCRLRKHGNNENFDLSEQFRVAMNVMTGGSCSRETTYRSENTRGI